ncbi:SPRY domain-containing protein [Xylariomycetidae sp. FL0641]|nr:SPRY domain-containing protein [Xylariomycetidae sp. FL0641]
MTNNPFHHGSPAFNPDLNFSSFLPGARSSYASIATGPNPSVPGMVRPRSLQLLLNPANDSSSELYSTHPSSRSHSMDTDMDGQAPEGGPSGLGPRSNQLPSFSRAFEMFMPSGSADSIRPTPNRNNSFFIPSYLQGSSYIQKLEQNHHAKRTRKGSQQQPGSGGRGSPAAGALGSKPPSAHRGMTYDLIERTPSHHSDGTIDPLPTRWNVKDKQGGLEVTPDGLEVKYQPAMRNSREPDHEVCGIRADHPMPPMAGIYYFEVTLLSRRRDETTVCIGFVSKNANLSRPPGWEPDSYGYHGDDGDAYSGGNVGKRYKDTFGPMDVVGCGVNFRTGHVFFTKNGKSQGTAFRDIRGKFYPAVGMKKTGEHVRVNFGQAPFIFDIDKVMREEQQTMKDAIAETSFGRLASPPKDETDLIQQLVLQFLQHDGYVETARAFAEEIHAEKAALRVDANTPLMGINVRDDEDAHHRQRIRRAILEGDIDKALKFTNAYYPHVLTNNNYVYFKLKCRKFIEMVRKSTEVGPGKKSNGHSYDAMPNEMDVDENGYSDQMEEDVLDSQTDEHDLLNETIRYGQALQAEFKDDPRREVNKALSDVFALLAYPNPLEVKEIAPLLDRKGRVAVAEELNSAILSSLGKSSRSALENLYGQTSVLLEYLREDGGPGSLVSIQSLIDEIPKPQAY